MGNHFPDRHQFSNWDVMLEPFLHRIPLDSGVWDCAPSLVETCKCIHPPPAPQHYPGHHLEAELKQQIQAWSSGGLFHNFPPLQAEFTFFRRAVSEEEMMESPLERRQN